MLAPDHSVRHALAQGWIKLPPQLQKLKGIVGSSAAKAADGSSSGDGTTRGPPSSGDAKLPASPAAPRVPVAPTAAGVIKGSQHGSGPQQVLPTEEWSGQLVADVMDKYAM